MESYREVVEQIRELHWNRLGEPELQQLMILSGYSAVEFAESLRTTLSLHPNNPALKEMAGEELDTNNLSFGDYAQPGDHSQFLWHFIAEYDLLSHHPKLRETGSEYIDRVRNLPQDVRVMSVVSREQELPGIFTQILTAPQWRAIGLPEYRYYLERHIALDSKEGGHADMLRDMPLDDRVADFYKARLDMYRSIPKLFE